MPMAPPRSCQCGGRIVGGKCYRCRPADDRPNSNTRGYDRRWRGYAARWLEKHPNCVCCEAMGKVNGERGRTGLRCDHIVPAKMAPELFWKPSNHQTICLKCDMTYKQPIERTSATAEQVRERWNDVLQSHAAKVAGRPHQEN